MSMSTGAADVAGYIAVAAVLMFLIGTCGGVFEKSGEERCAVSCGPGRDGEVDRLVVAWSEPAVNL